MMDREGPYRTSTLGEGKHYIISEVMMDREGPYRTSTLGEGNHYIIPFEWYLHGT